MDLQEFRLESVLLYKTKTSLSSEAGSSGKFVLFLCLKFCGEMFEQLWTNIILPDWMRTLRSE